MEIDDTAVAAIPRQSPSSVHVVIRDTMPVKVLIAARKASLTSPLS
jgi:hypothetical protein